jgi:hypothetical protein
MKQTFLLTASLVVLGTALPACAANRTDAASEPMERALKGNVGGAPVTQGDDEFERKLRATEPGTSSDIDAKPRPLTPDIKEKRGNTPPGLDRDGHGPSTGAIVDPSGAATKAKPF